MRRRLKKLVSVLLALAMVVTSLSLPVNETYAYAETETSDVTSTKPNLTDSVELRVDGADEAVRMQLYQNGVYETKVTLETGTHVLQVSLNGEAYGDGRTVTVTEKQEVYIRLQDGVVYDSITNPEKYHTATIAGNFEGITFLNESSEFSIPTWNPGDASGDLEYVGGGIFARTFYFDGFDEDHKLSDGYKVAFDHSWDRSIGDGSSNIALTIPKGTTEITIMTDEINNKVYDSINGMKYHITQNNGDANYSCLEMSVSLIGTVRNNEQDNWDKEKKGYEFRQISDSLFLYETVLEKKNYEYKVVFNYNQWYEKQADNKKISVTDDKKPVLFLYDAKEEALYDSINDSKSIAIKLGLQDAPVSGTVTTNGNGTTTFVTTVSTNENDNVQLVYAEKNDIEREKTIDLSKGMDSSGKFNGSFAVNEVFFGDDDVALVYYYKVNGNRVVDESQPIEQVGGKPYNTYNRGKFEGRAVYVPGTFPGDSWNPASNKMEYKGNGLYEYTFKNVPAGNIEFKIAMGTWDENYGQDGVAGGNNIQIAVPKTQDVTVKYMDLVTHYAVTSLDYVDAKIMLQGTNIPEGAMFTDPGLSRIYECKVALKAGIYSDVKAVYDGQEYKVDEFTLSEDREVTFYFDPVNDIYYNDSTKPEIDSSKVHFNSKETAYKSVYGAVCEGEKVTYSIDTGKDATNVKLVIKGTENKTVTLEKQEKDEKATWSGDVTLNSYGRYKYFFVVYYGSYLKIYCDNDGYYGTGVLTDLTSLKAYDLTVYKKGYTTPDWMKNAVIYQIFPDRFYNGDTSNDDKQTTARGAIDYEFITNWYTLPENPEQETANKDTYPKNAFSGDGNWSNEIYGGDLAGITKRMDYLKALGVNVIYLNPVFSSISSHRYDTSDYSKIDPVLGTLGDFEELVDVAKKNDMHIVLDGVFNHVSDDSVYFDRYYKFVGKDNKVGAYPYWAYVYDYMNENNVLKDEAVKAAKAYFGKKGVTDYSYTEWFEITNTQLVDSDGNNTVDTIGDRKGKPVYGYSGWWGYDSMPVIMSTNGSEYQTGTWGKEIIEGADSIGQYWLSKGSNGWRLDVANEVSDETWQHFRESVKKLDDDNVVIGEIWTEATQYLLGDMYDSVMNYVFRDAVCAFAKGGKASDSMKSLENIRELYPKEAFYAMMNLVSSHDTARILSYLDGVQDDRAQKEVENAFPSYETTSEEAKLKQYLVAFIQMTYPGAPTIYYGDEIGMVGADDPDDRRAMTWGEGNKELVEWYATLAKIRSEYSVLRTGSIVPFDVTTEDNKIIDSVMGYTRGDDDDQMIVLANNSEKETTVSISVAEFKGITSGSLYDLVSGEKYEVKDQKVTVKVPAYNGVILSQQKKTITIDAAALKPAYDPTYKVKSSVSATLDKKSVNLLPGGTAQLKATVTPKNAADVTLTWETNNAKVATVKDGLVTAVAKGTAAITLKMNGVKAAVCNVVVNEEEKVSATLDKKSVKILPGDTAKLKATISPRNATGVTIAWETSNAKVATVKDGLVTAVAKGTATITLKLNGVKAATCSVTVTGLEGATKLKVETKTTSTIKITWNKNSVATGYEVYRYANKKWSKVAKVTKNSYTDTKLVWGTLYSYKVRPYVVKGRTTTYGSYSNTIKATTASIKTPSKVQSVKVTKKSSSKVQVSWKKQSGVSGYQIYMKTNDGSYKKIKTLKGEKETKYTVSGLEEGYRYAFKVKAFRTVNGKTSYGKDSSGVAIRMPITAPKKATVKKVTRTSVKISFSKASGVSGYEIYRKVGNGSYKKLAVLKGSSKTSYQKWALTKGTKYTFKVRAYKVVGNKKYYSKFVSTKQIKL